MNVSFEHIDKNIFNASDIEEAMKAIVLQSGVTKYVYNNRPKAVAESGKDFVVVMVSGVIEDMKAYGTCQVLVSMFAQDAAGFKNGKKLGILQKGIMDFMPAECSILDGDGEVVKQFEIETTPMVLGDASDDFGYHARTIQYNILIKVL